LLKPTLFNSVGFNKTDTTSKKRCRLLLNRHHFEKNLKCPASRSICPRASASYLIPSIFNFFFRLSLSRLCILFNSIIFNFFFRLSLSALLALSPQKKKKKKKKKKRQLSCVQDSFGRMRSVQRGRYPILTCASISLLTEKQR
jgi:hypothetical protein